MYLIEASNAGMISVTVEYYSNKEFEIFQIYRL